MTAQGLANARKLRQTTSRRSTSKSQKALVAVSLFTGGGGLDLGLESVGWDIRFCTDIDPQSCITLQKGRAEAGRRGKRIFQNAVVLRGDVRDLEGSFIFDAIDAKKGEVQLLAGGPPCQAFSVFGKRQGWRDERGLLAYEYLRLLGQLEPEAFVFENVYGLMTVEGGKVFHDVCEKLAKPKPSLNYTISVLRLNAADYGVPQFRDRVFIVGSRRGKKVEIPHRVTADPHVVSMNGVKPWRTVSDALRGLPRMGASYPTNHTGRKHSQRIVDRYAGMSAGERDSHTRINKLDLTRPSFTIVVGSDKGGGKGHIHPREPREVTPRESARIQTFPDWWSFAGTVRHPIRQVGNAVPPLLGAAVGNAIRSQVFGMPEVPLKEVLDTLDQQHLFGKEL